MGVIIKADKSVPIDELKKRVSLRDLAGVKLEQRGGEWWGLCPLHSEKTPSFSIRVKDGTEVFHCFGCGAGGDAINFLKYKDGLDTKRAIEELRRMAGEKMKVEEKKQAEAITGLTIAQYAEAIKLPADWLEEVFGLSDFIGTGAHAGEGIPFIPGVGPRRIPVVMFPYDEYRPVDWDKTNQDLLAVLKEYEAARTESRAIDRSKVKMPEMPGDPVPVKYRWGMGGDERRWMKGSKIRLYGLMQLSWALSLEEVSDKYIFLPEGESDTQTLLYNLFPALGVSGTTGWRKEYAEHELVKDKIILVLQEPGAAAEELVKKVADSFPAGRVLAVKLPKEKDVSALWRRLCSEYGWADEEIVRAKFKEELLAAVKAATVVLPATAKPTEKAPIERVEKGRSAIELILAENLEPTRVKWMFQGIPLGKLIVFYGMPGGGKSAVAVDMIARGSRGDNWPKDEKGLLPPFKTIVLASEDDFDDTYIPRLIAAKADRTRVYFAAQTRISEQVTRKVALDKDLEKLEQLLDEMPDVRLVVIDPITAYLGSRNANKDEDVRPLLEALKDLAKRRVVTIIAITFFNKNSEQADIHRIAGAGAWGQVPRALWAFVSVAREEENKSESEEGPDNDDPIARGGSKKVTDHYMLKAKFNILKDSETGWRYTFDEVAVPMEGTTDKIVCIKWLGPADKTLKEVMDENKFGALGPGKPGPKPKRTNEAMEWLEAFLTLGPKLSEDIFEMGEQGGFGKDLLYTAKKRMGKKVKAFRDPPGHGLWKWRLDDNPEDSCSPDHIA